ncbi:MAG: hypothetical protein GY708_12730, partial [Actinomycetia bacterium]|nr:hypothetical protein [Actinomycetes bacterium]
NNEIVKNTSSTTTTVGATLVNNAYSRVTINDGVLSLAGAPLVLGLGAELEGTFATFDGDVISVGGLIGMSSLSSENGPLSITGSLTLDADSTLVFDIAGITEPTDFDYLNVTGDIILGGTAVILWDKFTAGNTDTFDLIRTSGASTISGAFSDVYTPNGTIGATFDNGIDPQRMQLAWTSTSPIVFWDINASGNWNTASNWSTGTVPGAG